MILKKIFDQELLKKLAPGIIEEDVILKVSENLIEKHLIENLQYLVFLDRIDSMLEEELDLVAKELHTDFYDYSMSIEEKRTACKKSFAIHRVKGTPYAVKEALKIFFKNAELQQWYEYNGIPGYFRVRVSGTVPEQIEAVKERINDSKKKSQHLEKLVFISNSNNNYYLGSHLTQGVKMSFHPARIEFSFNKTELKFGTGMAQYEKQGGKNGNI
ncbi:phage tail protein [Fusobacterium ulcerans]|uniref:phage tail protein n=1 Tax=Fusobacterium ulcerans TaxID=861 RepID=UPI0026DCC49D|nr:phage tail protein [Fusobacterium ulcerans]